MDLKAYLADIQKRCVNNGMHPDDAFVVNRFITENELKEKQKQYGILFDVICSVLDRALNFVKDVPVLIATTDNNPTIVQVFGDSEFVNHALDVGIQPGAVFKESYVGSNAPLAALELQTPVSLVGTDHFFKVLHNIACYSIPIKNVNHEVIATVSLLTSIKYAHPYILGMLSVSEIAIEREWECILNRND